MRHECQGVCHVEFYKITLPQCEVIAPLTNASFDTKLDSSHNSIWAKVDSFCGTQVLSGPNRILTRGLMLGIGKMILPKRIRCN